MKKVQSEETTKLSEKMDLFVIKLKEDINNVEIKINVEIDKRVIPIGNKLNNKVTELDNEFKEEIANLEYKIQSAKRETTASCKKVSFIVQVVEEKSKFDDSNQALHPDIISTAVESLEGDARIWAERYIEPKISEDVLVSSQCKHFPFDMDTIDKLLAVLNNRNDVKEKQGNRNFEENGNRDYQKPGEARRENVRAARHKN
ncbi:hypothetical protein FQA39_LY08287 [Lamprigera yunnana]|nr:hypothetical protein FQA39_LY08287 [Lamprigera yunnana]